MTTFQVPEVKVPSPPKHELTKSDCVVVGGLAIDVTCNISASADSLVPSSYPGTTERTLGGVGLNIAKASTFAGFKSGMTTRLVSAIGKNEQLEVTSGLATEVPAPVSFDQQGIIVSDSERTAQYIAMHDKNGDLIVACADMDIIKNMDTAFITSHIEAAKPSCVLLDGNIGPAPKLATVLAARSVNALVGFEPTSVEKAADIAGVPFGKLGQILKPVPNHTVDFSTPNIYELASMHAKLQDNEYFDVDGWFPVIDALSLGTSYRNRMELFTRSVPEISGILSDGTAQMAVQMLPYIPNLFVKHGARGVILFQLLLDRTIISQQLSQLGPNASSSYDIDARSNVVSAFFAGRDGTDTGLLVQHFPAIPTDPSAIVSVTGAGDTFCGILLAESAKNKEWLNSPKEKEKVLAYAQKCASLTIQSKDSVSTKILDL